MVTFGNGGKYPARVAWCAGAGVCWCGAAVVLLCSLVPLSCSLPDKRSKHLEGPDPVLHAMVEDARGFIAGPGVRGDTLRLPLFAPPRSWSPFAADAASRTVAGLLHEPMVILAPDATLRGGVVERWEGEPHGRTWRVTLREGVLWSNGSAVEAADLAWSIETALRRRYASLIGESQVSQSDSRTVTVALERGFPEFGWVLTAPLLARGVEYPDSGLALPSRTSGPFVAVAPQGSRRFVFVRNEHYWRRDSQGASLPWFDAVVCAVYDDVNRAHRAFGLGDLDVLPSLEGDREPQEELFTGEYALYNLGPSHAQLLVFNASSTSPFRPRMGDAPFRAALQALFDHESIARDVYAGQGGVVVPGYRGGIDCRTWQQGWEDDADSAAAQFAAQGLNGTASAGVRVDNKGNRLALRVLAAGRSALTTALAQRAAAGGVALEVVDISPGEHRCALQEPDSLWDAVLVSVVSDPGALALPLLLRTPFPFLDGFEWLTPEIDSLLDVLVHDPDASRRQAARCSLLAAVPRSFPALLLPAPDRTVLIAQRIGNVSPSPTLGVLHNLAELYALPRGEY